ncbi:hypothetical protein EB796_013470 [Bugula neritina]|uniref:SWIM-type domain-containing protein n=1 Tax=Bugula neritina TaxID=10212 RepID=A0A7J7JRG8_BUGNE|nr:hypothetical protein EB796_013470 [Bugula neritina]
MKTLALAKAAHYKLKNNVTHFETKLVAVGFGEFPCRKSSADLIRPCSCTDTKVLKLNCTYVIKVLTTFNNSVHQTRHVAYTNLVV